MSNEKLETSRGWRSGTRRRIVAVAIGTVATLGFMGLAYALSDTHMEASYALYWQGWLMQVLVPCVEVGSLGLLCENVPLNATLFWAGIPLGILVYSLAASAILRRLWRPA